MSRQTSTSGPLTGLSVLELGEMVAAPFCGKALADLGADVVKVEAPRTGDPARRRGPFAQDRPHPERSALFAYLNTGKRSVSLDLRKEEGREIFLRLLARADVLIENRPPGELERLGLSYERLSENAPQLIVTSVTPFGQTGPDRDARTHHLNRYHVGGHSSFWGSDEGEDRPPPRAGGHLGSFDAGLTAAVATMAAVLGRRLTGRGRHVDVSEQEAMMCLERVDIGTAANSPEPRPWPRMVGGLMQAKDGWFVVTAIQEHQWQGLVRAMGSPEWTRSEWCRDEATRMEHRDRIQPLLEEWAAGLDRDEIYHRCQAEGAPVGPVRSISEVRAWEQARARGFFRQVHHPEAGRLEVPTAPYLYSKTPVTVRRAPLLSEHNREVYGDELGLSPQELDGLARRGVI